MRDIHEVIEQVRWRADERAREQAAFAAKPEAVKMRELIASAAWTELCPDGICDGTCRTGVGCDLHNRGDRRCREYERTCVSAREGWLGESSFQRRYLDAHWGRVDTQWADELKGWCSRIEEHVKSGEGLLLLGGKGTGKSRVMTLVARALFDQAAQKHAYGYPQCPYPSRYVLVTDLIDAIFGTLYGREIEQHDAYLRASLLFVDDLDRAIDTTSNADGSKPLARLDAFFEKRYAAAKATVVAANKSADQLRSVPELERTLDRWRECMTVLEINAESQRGASDAG